MESIRGTFERLRRARRRALIPFIMGGDPDLAATGQLLLTLEAAGADLIEVGVPFSDPLADGPIIQAAAARALQRGTTPHQALQAVRAVRPRLRAPVVCLTYWNPLMQYGRDNGQAFLKASRACGIEGVVVPDVPLEEAGPLRRAAEATGTAVILLVAPTSPPARLRAIARASQGFIYYVSVTGTTGARRALPPQLMEGLRQLRLITTKPVCVGFGISTPAQAAAVARMADGVIVGSALLQAMGQARSRAGAISAAGRFIARLRRAV